MGGEIGSSSPPRGVGGGRWPSCPGRLLSPRCPRLPAGGWRGEADAFTQNVEPQDRAWRCGVKCVLGRGVR